MFHVIKTEGRARRGEFSCAHGGTVQTPVFMNVGTQGAIKGGVSAHDLKEIGCQIELSNTYHLHLRPGDDVVRQMGGLHRFMDWDGPILTDSGGFQVFSLASLRKIREEGVSFASHIDGRKIFMRAHSATHLLDAALREVLGDHVHQAGSLVEPDRLRFDFTHFSAITPEELRRVSELVNDQILEGSPVTTQVLPIEEARKLGATAIFGEKYGKTVRVVSMGETSGDKPYSMEFCGGTHLDNTAKVGSFHIRSETSVASGVRRIEATVGRESLAVMDRSHEMLFRVSDLFKTTPSELAEKAEQHLSELRELRTSLEKFRVKASLGKAEQFLTSFKEVSGLKVITRTLSGVDVNTLRQMGDFLRDKESGVVAVLAVTGEEKITFLAVCGKDAVSRGVKAGELVKLVSGIAGGSGGGKPDSAMVFQSLLAGVAPLQSPLSGSGGPRFLHGPAGGAAGTGLSGPGAGAEPDPRRFDQVHPVRSPPAGENSLPRGLFQWAVSALLAGVCLFPLWTRRACAAVGTAEVCAGGRPCGSDAGCIRPTGGEQRRLGHPECYRAGRGAG